MEWEIWISWIIDAEYLNIDLVSCLFLTMLTGSLVFGLWYGIGRKLEKRGYVNFLYAPLRIVPVFFLFPIVYLFLQIQVQSGEWGGVLFLRTPLLKGICQVLAVIWMAGVVGLAFRVWRECRKETDRLKGQLPVKREVREIFVNVCRLCRVNPKRVQVVQSYGAAGPCLCGIVHPRIVLPVQEYSKEALEVIFHHELTHYRHKDIWWKYITMAVKLIYWMNPVVWKYCRLVDEWSEYACDDTVCRERGGMQRYFGVITDIAQQIGKDRHMLISHLIEDQGELRRRVLRMRENRQKKRKKTWMALAAASGLILASGGTVFAAGYGAAAGYVKLYRLTDVAVEVPLVESTAEIFMDNGPEEGIIVEYGEINPMIERDASIATFIWNIKKKRQMITGDIYLRTGDPFFINARVTPENKLVNVGIVFPNGNRQYVTGTGDVIYRTNIPKSGLYQVFVENISDVEINVTGAYY